MLGSVNELVGCADLKSGRKWLALDDSALWAFTATRPDLAVLTRCGGGFSGFKSTTFHVRKERMPVQRR